MDTFSFLSNTDISTIETLYQDYLQDPNKVEASWKDFFRGFEFARANYEIESTSVFDKEFNVIKLIEGYRRRGHLFTKTNPVRTRRVFSPNLAIENFGLSEKELDVFFQAGHQIGIGKASLRNIIEHLKQTYCQSIGAEYIYSRKPEVLHWLEQKMESCKNSKKFTTAERQHIFEDLKKAVGFEQFIHRRFVGQKRFSLEGAETVIPALNAVIDKGSDLGIEEFVIGMPHRGRLNVLANVLKKPYETIFQEFMGKEYGEEISAGDVKYHLGFINDVTTHSGKTIRLNLVPNPSHLETVSGVTQGITRAKIYHKYQEEYSKIAPILIHGDAAIAAQGIVYEVIQMSQLEGYKTGGTIHLIINNQVGFTTNYLDARSSTYCTDIAKVTLSPVFHVNGDDSEALIYTITLAMEYRQRFHPDVFVDILCYRRYGHNEGDEPRFTQPILYKAIEKHPNSRDIYAQHLIQNQIYTQEKIDSAIYQFDALLEERLELAKQDQVVHIQQFLYKTWKNFKYAETEDFFKVIDSKVQKEVLIHLTEKINFLPSDKKFFSKTIKLIEDRKKMVAENRLDWAMCELLAYSSLVNENIAVRLSGQDVERGTFSHRHAIHVIEDSDERYFPLKHISENQAPIHIYNSPLSEYGVLGFEYGYALATPKYLTIWEAQFGDFNNVAQPIIDQYIVSAEDKWGLMNGLVMYLPHGYEGQGSEHSSARMERFLTLAVNNNIQILNCTTPANLFHALRRHMLRDFRTPLIIFTPKSLLRHPKCISTFEDLSEKTFQEVIDDENVTAKKVTRVVFCTGKIYYDLLERKTELDAKDVALIRIEQLHPFPTKQLKKIVAKYQNRKLALWVQEEPENMGAWRYIQNEMKFLPLEVVSRQPSTSPATGLYKLHVKQQTEIIDKVFRKCTCELQNIYCALQCIEGKKRSPSVHEHRLIFEEPTL